MKRFVSSFPSISTFCQIPYCEDINKLDFDVKIVVVGIPWDEGVGFIPGQRLAPKQIRDNSARFRLSKDGFFVIEKNKKVLQNLKIFDIGDIGMFKTLTQKTFDNISESIKELVNKNIFPIVFGGDHSITYPIVRGFNKYKKLDIIQIDAHLDFNQGREGVVLGNENAIRRISELPFVSSIVQIGIRGMLASEESYVSAKKRKNIIITIENIRKKGVGTVLKNLPQLKGNGVYITFDIDSLDPSIAPGTATREPNGLNYEEARQLLHGLTKLYSIVGLDIVEVNPLIDPSGLTAIMATRLILDFLISYCNKNNLN